MDWQPIDTAPKADTVILLYDPKVGRCTGYNPFGAPSTVRSHNGAWPYDCWLLGTERDYDGSTGPMSVDDGTWDHASVSLEPTHWMPLPGAPHLKTPSPTAE